MRREATIYAERPISASAVAKPQHDGSWRALTNAPACRSDSYHMRRRGARSFVDDLVLSRGVVLSRADLFCDLLRLSPMTRRFVRFRRTYLPSTFTGAGCMPDGQRTFRLHAFSRFDCTPFHASTAGCMPDGQRTSRLHAFSRFDCTPFHASTSGCMPDGRRTLTIFR